MKPPYYAVIFTSERTEADAAGYAETSKRMRELAAEQPGFLGIESVRTEDGTGITVSYWSTAEAVARWKEHLEHREAQKAGRLRWYRRYRVRVAKVEREYGFEGDGS